MAHASGKTTDQVFDMVSRMILRLSRKLPSQMGIHEDHLPSADVDLTRYFNDLIPQDLAFDPSAGDRSNMAFQAQKLRHDYRGQPEILALHMLTISYLRRRTEHTNAALYLFTRIWEEHNEAMLELITPRDLVSALRTFADHAPDHERVLLAKLGFQYATMIKIYESERRANGQTSKSLDYKVPTSIPKTGIDGLYGVPFGVDNSLEIIHMHLLEEIEDDFVIGPMVATLMRHIFDGETVFSRVDQSRIDQDFETDLLRGWSFGFNPLSVVPDTLDDPTPKA